MLVIRAACALPLALPLFVGTASAQSEASGTPFVDHFDNVDRDRWVVSDGWSSGDWMANDWRAGNVSTRGEGLQITLAQRRDLGSLIPTRIRQLAPTSLRRAISYAFNGDSKHYSSGEVSTQEQYRYGYFEARMRAARGSGLVSGFFTFAREGGETTWDEIDIEILGRDTQALRASYYSGGQVRTVVVPLGFDAADASHTYGIEWSPKRIRWIVDGEVVHEEQGEHLPLPTRPQRLFFSLWNTSTLNSWLGPIVPNEGPWRLGMECVATAREYEGRELCAAGAEDETANLVA